VLVTFRVLRRHESGATRRNPCLCPVANCIAEKLTGYDYLGVGGDVVSIRGPGEFPGLHLPLPADVVRYVAEYDDLDRQNRPVRLPAAFTLDVPDRFVQNPHVRNSHEVTPTGR
jgi:hypothetical protein